MNFPPPVRGPVRLSFVLSTLDHGHIEPLLIFRSFSCLGSSPFVSDFLHLSSLLIVRSCFRSGSPSLVSSFTCFESILLASDSVTLGSQLFLQCFAQPGLTLLVPNLLHPGFSLLVRSLAHLDLNSPLFGMSRCGFTSLALDCTLLKPAMLLQSSVWLGMPLPVLDPLHSDTFLPFQVFSHLELSFSAFRLSHPDLTSPILDCTYPDLVLLLQLLA